MTTIIVPIVNYVNKKIGGVWNMTRFGKDRNLSFSNRDVLGKSVIALDNRKRKLLFFRQSEYRQSCLIVDLNNIDSCSIYRQYNGFNAGSLQKHKLHTYLTHISLFLRFKNMERNIVIPFFESHYNNEEDVVRLEGKAHKWRGIISKLLPIRLR